MNTPARGNHARAASPVTADELLESRPDLVDRIASGDPTALAEFFDARGADVTSVRFLDPEASDVTGDDAASR